MKNRKRAKTKCAVAYALFRADLPFGHKIIKDKTKYNRKTKHIKKDLE